MISIIYSTNRINPRFDWFLDSLYAQTTEEERTHLELVFIDFCLCPTRADMLKSLVNDRFQYIASKPKPNIYQGSMRKTKNEYFSPSNARNTGIVMSNGGYLAFVDDVSVLMPTWFHALKCAMDKMQIVCGAYQKHYEMVVEQGLLKSSRKHDGGIDSRWNLGDDNVPVRIFGQQMFGCSLGIPASYILEVNGFDELCDSIGGEDYQLGIRLNNADRRIYYDRRMLSIESEELHNQDYLMRREDRVLDEPKYMERLRGFGVERRCQPGNLDSSHMILDVLNGTKQIKSIYNNRDLAQQRSLPREERIAEHPPEILNHWFDHKPLSEM